MRLQFQVKQQKHVYLKTIISFCKVPVEGSNDSVLSVRIINMSCPLANARATGISKYYTTGIFKFFDKAISFYCKSYQLTSGGDSKFRYCFYSFAYSIF